MYGTKEARQLMHTTNYYFEFLLSNVKTDEHNKPNLLSFVHLFPSYGSEQLSWLKWVLLPHFYQDFYKKGVGAYADVYPKFCLGEGHLITPYISM